MAIQLDCPACSHTLKTPDSAMGNVTRCPECQAQLRVPRIEIPKQQVRPAASSPLVSAPVTEHAEPSDTGFPFADDSPFGFTDEPATAASKAPEAPVYLDPKERQKRMARRARNGVIAALLVAVTGIGLVYFWSTRNNLNLTADASVVPNAPLSRTLAQGEMAVAETDWLAIVGTLQQRPSELRSPEMVIRMESGNNGLTLSLTPTSQRQLLAVSTQGVDALTSPSTRTALQEAWKQSVSSQLTSMSGRLQDATAAGTVANLGEFGTTVGINGLAGPLGMHLWAIVGDKGYPCVFEDAEHRLYFLVPAGTTSVTVQPREDAPGRSALPARLKVFSQSK